MKKCISFVLLAIGVASYCQTNKNYYDSNNISVQIEYHENQLYININRDGKAKSMKLRPIDTEFIKWYMNYFGNTDLMSPAYQTKYKALKNGNTNEPKEMISKLVDTFEKGLKGESWLIIQKVDNKERFNYFVDLNRENYPMNYNDEILFVSVNDEHLIIWDKGKENTYLVKK